MEKIFFLSGLLFIKRFINNCENKYKLLNTGERKIILKFYENSVYII